MIFSKHKKQGAEVGRAIKKTLLMGTAAWPINKKNKLLAAAINDPYVKGFVIYLSAMSIDMVFKGALWKKKKRIEFLIECWQELGIPMKKIHEFLRTTMSVFSDDFSLLFGDILGSFWDHPGIILRSF